MDRMYQLQIKWNPMAKSDRFMIAKLLNNCFSKIMKIFILLPQIPKLRLMQLIRVQMATSLKIWQQMIFHQIRLILNKLIY
ncbi:unnamed protein product [Paramecium octaurelia]|uniref:Uncharacterized protein n=1 Tax=Paramecium octaurelia TaxID=43137 RepID=A0A8S1TZE6_PAROT|nr:unnamed protein product [Paramecium octaurelia]